MVLDGNEMDLLGGLTPEISRLTSMVDITTLRQDQR